MGLIAYAEKRTGLLEAARRLRVWIFVRLILWLVRRCRPSSSHGSSRTEYTIRIADWSWELFVRVRDLRQPETYTREEIVRMLETVRLAEFRMDWDCPDEPPKAGKLIYRRINGGPDTQEVPVFYCGFRPTLEAGPFDLARRAREIVAVDVNGREWPLKGITGKVRHG